MTAELVTYQPPSALSEQMDYARAVQSANMLPEAYRGKPADIMLAVGLGQSMGLSPAESLYRINVIKGKPTASAELIAANVRKAGHRLRVRTDGLTITASIWRGDDPDFEHQVVRDEAWAKRMGLISGTNYQKQAQTMLQWRAITAVARLACPEALYGVAYTPDEMWETEDRPSSAATAPASAADRMAGILGTEPAQPSMVDEPSDESPLLNTSSNLAKRMFALFGEIGLTEKSDRLAYVNDVIGRTVASSTEMTDDDAHRVIAAIERDQEQPFPDVTDAELVDDTTGGDS